MRDSKGIYEGLNLNSIKYGFTLLALIILSSCINVKPGASKSGKKLYETFFVGDAGTQYFIKPLVFGNNSNEKLELDITFRYKNETKDSAIVNISFLVDEIFKNADSLQINNDSVGIVIREMKFMFSDRAKEKYHCRFSCKMKLIDVKNLFENSDWRLMLFKKEALSTYMPTKNTKTNIEKLNYEIFSIF